MSFLSDLTAKAREIRGLPPITPDLPVVTRETPVEQLMPELNAPSGIDFHALWEEPQDSTMLPVVISGVAAVLSLITMIIVIIK